MSLNKRIVSLMSFSIKMCLSFVSKYAKYNDAGISSNLTGIKSPELEFEPFQLFKLNKREAIFTTQFSFSTSCYPLDQFCLALIDIYQYSAESMKESTDDQNLLLVYLDQKYQSILRSDQDTSCILTKSLA